MCVYIHAVDVCVCAWMWYVPVGVNVSAARAVFWLLTVQSQSYHLVVQCVRGCKVCSSPSGSAALY